LVARKQALGIGVVISLACPAHRLATARRLQQGAELPTRLLPTSITVHA
jgi:hypothetical protein